MFSWFFLITSDDKYLNWLNNKLRFGGGFRYIDLPVLVFFLLLLRTNELKFWFLIVPKRNTSMMYLQQNHGSAQVLMCWKSSTFKWLHLEWIQNLLFFGKTISHDKKSQISDNFDH